MSALN